MDSASLAAMGYYAAEEDKLRRQRQEQSNPIDAIGKTALAAGAIAAAILGGRRLGGLKNTSSTVDLSNINPNAVRRAAGRPAVDIPETVVASRTPPPVVRTAPKSTLERLGDMNEGIRQAREERPQGITFVSQLGEEPVINTPQIIVPKTTTKETPTGQGFGLDYLNSLLGRKPAVEEVTRQARNERSQGIPFLDLSDEVRTSVDPWSGKETILTPFGSPTVPPVRTTETTTRGTQLLSPAAPDAADRLLNDPDLLRRVNKEYNVGQEAKKLAIDNLLSSNRSEQAKQAARRRQVLTATGDDIISTLRSEANTAQAAAQGDYAQQYLKTAGYKDADTMVDLQVSNTPRNTDQTLNAIDAAEDQQTGRVYQQLQRNEDLDLNQIEIMEEMATANRRAMMEGGEPTQMIGYEADGSINQVASQLPDGLPADQAEGLKQNPRNTAAVRFMQNERNKISLEMAPLEGNERLSPGRVEQELANRLSGSTASSYGPKYTARKQALELYAQTGDPQFLETVERYGLKPVTFNPDSEEITSLVRSKNIVNMPGVGEVSTASLRRPVITESTARQADEFIKRTTQAKLNNNPWLEGIASEVEQGKQEIYSERKQLAEQTGKALKLQLEQARARGQGNTVRKLETQIQTLRDIYSNPELAPNIEGSFSSIGRHRETGRESIDTLNKRLRGAIKTNNQQIAALEKRYPTTLTNPSGEVNRLFGILDDEGEFIPETMELRSERRMVDTAPKGGSGRGIAEYAAGSRNEYAMGNSGRPPLFQRVGQEDDVMTKKYRLVESAQPQSNLRDYHLETGGTADSFENDRTDTVSRAYTTPGGSREVLLYPTTETLIPARSQQHQTIPGKYVTSLIGRNQKLQGPPLKKVLPIVIQNKGETGVGSTIDRYGIRRDLDPVDDITLRPSEPVYTEDELRQEALRLALYDPYGDAPISRPSSDREQMEKEAAQSLGSQPKTLAGRQSINASEEIRRIQRSNPPAKAQALVSSFLQQLKGA